MQDLKTKAAVQLNEVTGKSVLIFLQSSFYTLNGAWQWDMATEAVFCSDVMFSLPHRFAGTKGIFHPDDVAGIKELLSTEQVIGHLSFRIINTYGEVKTLVGENISVSEEAQAVEDLQQQAVQALLQEMEQKRTHNYLHLLNEIGEKAARLSGAGSWYYNSATHQTWYSDYVFQLHGLPAQALNAHLHTFHPFIHPEDRDFVMEFTDKAFRDKAPLHIDYRIVVHHHERWVAFRSFWLYSEQGEDVLAGIFQDITEKKAAEGDLERSKNLVQFQRQQVLYDEQQVNVGHWQVALLTRKTTYSDHFYRIFGIKPASLAPTITSFLSYVHPDDRDRVETAFKKIIHEHEVPDIEYRIIRGDGKVRHILQKGKLLLYEQELIVSGIIQDLTVQRMLEEKVAHLQEKLQQKSWLLQQGDEVSNTFSWVMDGDEKTIDWSESFYRLIGCVKTQTQNLTEKTLFSLIHPHDVKAFRKHWEEAVHHKQAASFHFRTMQRGSVHYMKAVFSHITLNEKGYFIGTVQDTTGEQVLQQQLSQRVQLAESLTENIPDRVMITDSNNTILLWNKACEEAYEVKKTDAIGQNFFDLFPHLKTEEEIQLFHRVYRGEKVVVEGAESVLGNGYYNLYLLPLYTGSEVTGVLHVINDVTKETELRHSLHERLLLIESIVQSSVDRIIALDRHLNYLYWNKRAEEYYGLPKEEVVGKNILEVFPRLVNDPSYPEIRRALKGETVYMPVAPGQDNFFETYLIPIKGKKGEVTSLLWVAHDLTPELQLQKEQQKAQQQLLEEHRRLKEAQAIGHVGSFEWNAATDTVYWSDEMYHIHGLKLHSEIITLEKVISFVHPEDRENVVQLFSKARKEAVALNISHRLLRADGAERVVIRKLQSFADETGAVTHLSGTVQDITEQKKAEQEIIRLKEEIVQKATDKYLTLFNSIDEGFYLAEVIFDEANRPVDVFYHEENPAAVRILGTRVKGKKLTEINPNYERHWFEIFGSVALTGESKRLEEYAEPNKKWFNFYVVRLGGEDSRMIAIVFQDTTEQKRLEQKRAFLSEVSEDFSRLASEAEIIESIGRRLAEHLHLNSFNLSYVDKAAGTATVKYAWNAAGMSMQPGATYRFADHLTPDFEHTMQAGDLLIVADVQQDARIHAEAVVALGVGSFVVVPYHSSGQWVGCFSIQRPDAHNWTADEINLISEVTARLFPRLDRANAEQALRQSEEKYRNLFNTIDEGFCIQQIIFDETGNTKDLRYLTTNPAFERLTGFTNAVGKTTRELLPGIEDSWLQIHGEIAKTGKAIRYENHTAVLDKWFEVYAFPVGAPEEGKVAALFNDITQRKNLEQQLTRFNESLEQQVAERTKALQESTEQLQKNLTILQHAEGMAQMGSWEYHVATGAFSWSEGMYNLFGLPQGSKVAPETYLDFAVEQDRSVAKRIIKNLKRGQQSFEETMRIKRGNEQRLLKVKGSVLHDETGRGQRVVGVDVDITNIKEAEQKAEESRNLLEQTALASPDAITIYEFTKKQPVYLNNCLAEWIGTTTEQLVKMGIDGRLQLIHADDRLRLLHFNEKLKGAKDGQVLTLEYRIHTKNDTLLWIRNRSKPFRRDSAGNVTQVLSVLQDVTDEKAAEQVLKDLNASLEKKNVELESKNEEITSFAFVASHDLREPLRKIHTFSDWLLTKEPGLTEPGRQTLEKMTSSVKRLDQLINDILALTKVHVGNERPKPVDLNAVVQQLREEMQEQIERTGAVIEAEPLPKLIGAENQLLYLLQNLISNGIKFQPPEGRPHIRIKAEREAQYIKISIQDNGIGIPPEYHKRIFEIFRRLHGRHEYEGTGMGLAICKKIMEKHGGKIEVESKEGEGATFTCRFPASLCTN